MIATMEAEKPSIGTDSAEDVESNTIEPTPSYTLPERPKLPKWRLVCLVISVCFGLFLSLMDTTIIATALYTIGVDLKALGSVNWVALSYTLAYLGCAVIFARISDIIGRKSAYIAAFIIFFAFSLGCGFSQTLNQLIACRALQGVGGAGLYSLTFVILPEVSPPEVQKWIAALSGAVVAMSGVLGPVLGGIITNYTTWRWVFWINAPIGIIPFVLFIVAWPKPHQLFPIQRRLIKDLDFIGAFLVIAGSVLVVFSFQEAGIRVNSWKTALFIAPLLVGCTCWVLLFGWEHLVARRCEEKLLTMFPLRVIRQRVYIGYVISTLLAGFPYFMVIYTLPQRLQVVNGKNPLMAGVSILPMLASVAIGSTIGGAVNGTKNRTFHTLLAGSILLVIGTATLSTLTNSVKVQGGAYGFQVFVGLGFGLTVSTVSLGATLECEVRDMTVAQGIIAQVRVLGGSIGIAASTAILAIAQQHDLSGIVSPEQLATLQTSAKTMTRVQLHAVRQAYSDAFSEDMKVCAAISGACVLAAFVAFRKNPPGVTETRTKQITDEQRRLRRLGDAKLAEAASEESK